jgi:hypothetical protein
MTGKVKHPFSVIISMGNMGMEKRPRRFSLPEAYFEGSRLHSVDEGEV